VDALGGLALPILFLVVLYLLLIRPQQRRQKQHRQLVSNLSVGVDVVTIGGVHGRVIDLADETMDLQVTADEDVVIRFQRSALARVVPNEPESPNA
jgi:preprotein translocase subunit YajC